MPDRRENPTGNNSPLEEELRRLSHRVAIPPRPQYAALIQQRLDPEARPSEPAAPSRRSRRWRLTHPLVTAGVVLLVLLSVLVLPAGRRAMAALFEFGGVRVNSLPSSALPPRTTLDPGLDLGEPATLAQARRQVSFAAAVPSRSGLGAPDAVYVRRGVSLESLTLVYLAKPGLPAVANSPVGLILTEYAGTATPYFDKYETPGSLVTRLTVAGRWPGIYFSGPQEVLIRDDAGRVHNEHPRVSAPTLVWVRGAVTYRLEANISQRRAIEVAASVS